MPEWELKRKTEMAQLYPLNSVERENTNDRDTLLPSRDKSRTHVLGARPLVAYPGFVSTAFSSIDWSGESENDLPDRHGTPFFDGNRGS